MFRKQVRKRLSKFKLRLSSIYNFLTYFKKIASKVMVNCKSFHSNFLNNTLLKKTII